MDEHSGEADTLAGLAAAVRGLRAEVEKLRASSPHGCCGHACHGHCNWGHCCCWTWHAVTTPVPAVAPVPYKVTWNAALAPGA